MGNYGEYLDRVQWKPSEKLHTWVASRIIKEFDKRTGIQGKSVLEVGTGTGRLAHALQVGGLPPIRESNQIQVWRIILVCKVLMFQNKNCQTYQGNSKTNLIA
jgi:hypothetical protein